MMLSNTPCPNTFFFMNACVLDTYGDPQVLHVQSVPKPILSLSSHVLVRVKAAGINPVDFKVRKGFLKPVLSLPLPCILGIDFSGIVEDPGQSCWSVGDPVYGKLKGMQGHGTYADYVLVDLSQDALYSKPMDWSFEQCCVGVPLLTAWIALDRVPPGRLLILGASGGVGAFATQIAKAKGFHITAVCSAKNHEYVQSWGAHECIDYHTQLDRILTLPDWDVCLDCVGGDDYFDLVRSKIRTLYCTVVGPAKYGGAEPLSLVTVLGLVTKLVYRSWFSSPRYQFVSDLPIPAFQYIDAWIKEGKVKPLPVTRYSFSQCVQAHEASETHRTVGKIVLVPDS
jgi:NADPH:quinone reductase-like Zn-dependent oxidoreductase